jgi:hypothetical protein
LRDSVHFERYHNGHVITVPVTVADYTPTRFVLDTGIGANVISTKLCGQLGLSPTGETLVGKRMSGQSISAPLTRIPSISLNSLRQENVPAGIFDVDRFFPKESGIEGFLSPQFFEPWPFAINSLTQTVRIQRVPPGTYRPPAVEVPVMIQREGPSVQLFVDLRLPSGSTARVEVDTGSDNLILHSRYMRELGVSPDRSDVKKVEGTDETGHTYVRYFASVPGTVSLAGGPSVLQRNPAVMFQDIIYDGLIGDTFLRSYDVTYDLARSRLLFGDPES